MGAAHTALADMEDAKTQLDETGRERDMPV
jgi:hypothetical protein